MIVTDTVLLSKKELCDTLGVSLATLNRMIAARAIPFVRMRSFTGGKHRVYFERKTIHAWAERRLLSKNNTRTN